MSRHRLFDPEGLPLPSGFSYGAIAGEGRLVHLAGLTGHREDGSIDASMVDQFGQACANVRLAVEAAGGAPSDVVAMTIYTSAIDEYRSHLGEIGTAYRQVFGKHYPPIALLGVSELFDPAAKVELVCVAVVPG